MTRQPAASIRFAGWILVLFVACGPLAPVRSQTVDPAAAEEARERRAMERYVSLLENNPRRGTALDRVYGYHVERGTLDDLIKSYRDRLARKPGDGVAASILGMLEFQRGQDAAAVAAFRRAEAARPDDPLPPYYLGQALVMVGQPDQAAEAFERAVGRKPARNDMLEIFQALGRVYQRTQRTEQAQAVWTRLDALFPDDARVQEQIAVTLAEEDQPAQALPRLEALAKRVRDPFRQVQLAMQAAELKVRLGRSAEALRDFEGMLGKLRPDSWLHKEVRRKIEEVFLRSDDRAGLVSYYEAWTKKDPEDIEALLRLGRTLATMGRVAEAQPWYEKAIKLAPGRRDLRIALIAQLAQDQKIAEAAAQYAELDRAEPNNPDTIKDWGGLVLRDQTRPQAERKAAAASIWRKLLDARPNDPVTTAQVADLMRQAEMTDDALALYRKAIEQAPGNPQYREYLGEYLHRLKRPAEAMAEWARIAEGSNRTPKNLTRLGEILAGFGYLKESIAPLEEAVKLEPDDFDLQLRLAGYLERLSRFDEAESHLAAASRLASRDEQRAAVLEARVENDQAAGRLAARIDALRKDLDAHPDAPAVRWIELARYLEADGKLPEAVRATARAIAVDGRSIPAWTLAARVRESAGSLGDAAEAMRHLADVDRRNRAEYLTAIARLESRLGRVDEAIKVGRELLAATSASPEHSEFFAQLCFQHGRVEEGLDALRRAVRANPNDARSVLSLAETLAGQYQLEEAIEMYWRAFDRAEVLDNKLEVVRKLTELYLQNNQLDRLLTRLQHQDRDDRAAGGGAAAGAGAAAASAVRGRDVAMCLAQAYASSGDLGSARAELERLLATSPRDTALLAQLSKLTEEEGDTDSAARYQKQLVELAASDDGLARLGELYARAGDLEEAQSVWSRLAAGQGAALHVTMAMDSLLFNKKPLPVLETTAVLLRTDPHNWEALYRRGMAAVQANQRETAEQAFRALLDTTAPDDEPSALARARARNPRMQVPNSYPLDRFIGVTPLDTRISLAPLIRSFAGLDSSVLPQRYYWSPADFGQARLAALGVLSNLMQKRGSEALEAFLASIRTPAEKRPADPRALWQWFYLCSIRLDYPNAYAAAREICRAAPTDPLALWAYLHSLGTRELPPGQRAVITQQGNVEAEGVPLEPAELDFMLATYRSLQARRPELAQAEVLQYVDKELRRAKRGDEETRFYREVLASASRIGQVAAALNMAALRGDVDGLIDLAERYEHLQTGRTRGGFSTGSFTFAAGPFLSICQGMSACADRKAYADILRLLDLDLAATRRKMERQSTGAAGRAWRAQSAAINARGIGLRAQRIWIGSSYRSVVIDFPRPNEYLDNDAIMVLRTAFELYKRDDLLSDLIAHFRGQANAATSPAAAVYPRLALSALLWWSESRDEAIAELTRVVDASRPESDLRLDLCEVLEQQGDFAAAVTMLDAVQPLDNLSLRRREELALRVAVRTGNIERARQAAERLFGLRLDTETQIAVSGQMHQLGLHELAEALLGRARRRAGNKTSALAALMLQYQRQDRLDQAVQVAMQILRSTPAAANLPGAGVILLTDDPSAARNAAVTVLARSGRLEQLIARANEELEKTPNAVPIHRALADYYTAARQPAKARAELLKVIELRPDDVSLRLQVAAQLASEGQSAAAVAQYQAAFRKDPSQLNRFAINPIVEAFRKAGKTSDLLDLISQDQAAATIDPYTGIELVQELLVDAGSRDRAMAAFRRIWAANPTYHMSLLSYMVSDELWKMPETYEMARGVIVSRETAARTAVALWYAFYNPSSPVVAGQAQSNHSPITRILDLATERGRLLELAHDVEAELKARPSWIQGDFYLALIHCRTGRYDAAASLVRKLLDPRYVNDSFVDSTYPLRAYMMLGKELEDHAAASPELRGLAIALYEGLSRLSYAGTLSYTDLDAGPVGRLARLFEREGRLDDVRRVLLESARTPPPVRVGATEDTLRQMRILMIRPIARRLVEIGFTGDAIPLYSEAVALAAQIDPDGPLTARDMKAALTEVRAGFESVMQGLPPEELAALAQHLILDAATDAAEKDAARSRKTAPRDLALDLVTLVHPRPLDRAVYRSILAESLAACNPGQLAELDGPLEKLSKAHPDDFSVAIATALRAIASGETSRVGPALARLNRLVERTPLEALAPGARANARQRTEAARQIPLWLVARVCSRLPDAATYRPVADRLSARAFEAARRQSDNLALMALLREQGEAALARGDREAAEVAWGRMLDMVMPTPVPRARRPGAAQGPAGQPGMRPRAARARPSE